LNHTDCGFRIADRGLNHTDCGFRVADCRLNHTDCGFRISAIITTWFNPQSAILSGSFAEKDHRIREMGTHQELLKLKGIYWKLYQLQYKDQLSIADFGLRIAD
jgi:hypothetical protein